MIPLRGLSILPGMITHFDISRDTSRKAVEAAMVADEKLFVVAQRDSTVASPTLDDLYTVGTTVEIKQVVRLPKNMIRVLVEGKSRAELCDFEQTEGYLTAEIHPIDNYIPFEHSVKTEAMIRNLKETFQTYAAGQKISADVTAQIMQIRGLDRLMSQIAGNIPISPSQRQRLLESADGTDLYDTLMLLLTNEAEIMKIRNDLQEQVKARIDKNQKDYILREQVKEIRKELGDDNVQSDIDNFKEQTEKLNAPKEIKELLNREIRRFSNVTGNPSESGVVRGYIETLLSLPWNKASRDNRDLAKARAILEEDHYGLEKVKERILEYLAVRLATKKGDAPIICLVGPPGTGKTSISKSIARALNKKYIRVSLGGVRDEAEIRGHRRTYIGAMPGRIINGMRQAKVRNPLMLLDEIDKTGSDYRGDVSSALLELLDPEENSHFTDHYIEAPVDLSDVLFVATANDAGKIPRPLLDRMEIIEINSYTENEKMHIAKEHLIPKQQKTNGIKDGQLTITDEALAEIIGSYTREAGVRSLERQIGTICRKTALRIQENASGVIVSKENLEDFLGRSRFTVQMANEKPEIGIVRGLAWTSVGGTTLEIEVNIMPGKGAFQLTGQLGDVMKESAQTGISYIRSVAKEYGIDDDFFTKNDIHIHIPEGAVPKDGPSAGITMATAMLSAITKRPVRPDIAMTGEITLRGRVLPIGGLKEKLLAAKKAGMHTVLVPEKNRPDVLEMDHEITDGLEIKFVTVMAEVLAEAWA